MATSNYIWCRKHLRIRPEKHWLQKRKDFVLVFSFNIKICCSVSLIQTNQCTSVGASASPFSLFLATFKPNTCNARTLAVWYCRGTLAVGEKTAAAPWNYALSWVLRLTAGFLYLYIISNWAWVTVRFYADSWIINRPDTDISNSLHRLYR